jgi:SulP family sulfate permease
VAGGALLLLFVVRRYPRGLALPAVLMALTLMFVLLQPHHPSTQMSAEADGAPAYALLRALQALPYADWPALARHTGDIVAIVAISVFMVLVHARGIGLSLGHKVDLDDELRQTGTTNLLAGMLGACGGYHYVSDTLLVQKMGGGRRWVAVVVALGAGATMAAGEWLLILFPAALLASLLGFIGLTFLVEWLYDRRRTLARTQYVMMVAICAAMACWGLTAGFIVAIVVTVVDDGWRRMRWAEGSARDAVGSR